ncbi:MAG: hypothetical protein HC819_23795 [Cyclobacteriaceae bacterium]|nr:hypothetical protein [Cyclobacteriaceae bacterium]
MSKQELATYQKEIDAIPIDLVKTPTMPVAEAVQEAENLAAWCIPDKDALVQAGLNWAVVESLSGRAGACRYAQSIWAKEYLGMEEAQREWKERSALAFGLRDELVHHFLWAFRTRPDLISKVQTISDGATNADMLQDLSDLAVLGKENAELLKSVGIDTKLLAEAETTADELSVVLATANGEGADGHKVKNTRDRAYTYMKMALDEIRATGQYVFWRNEARKKGYVSNYFKMANLKKKRPPTTEE